MKHSSRLTALLAGLAITISGVGPAAGHAARAPGYQGTITVYASDFTPSTIRPVTATTLPHTQFLQVAAAWERLHPGINVRFVDVTPEWDQDYSGYFTVMRTRIIGGTAPDILTAWVGWDDGLHNDALTLNLYPYLSRPNKYIAGNAQWMDAIAAPYRQVGNLAIQDPLHDYEAVPLDVITTGVFYNKDLATKLGLSMPPKTMDEFTADIKVARQKGYLGFFTEGSSDGDWSKRAFSSAFMMGDVRSFDFPRPWEGAAGKDPGWLTAEEWARAYKKLGYLPSKDPGLVAYYKWYKTFVDLWTPGWASDTAGLKPLQYLDSGKLLFEWNTTGFIPQLVKVHSAINYGTFWFPNFTQNDSSAIDPQIGVQNVGGFGHIGLEINAKAAADPAKLAALTDFLQYVTSPKPDAAIVNEVPETVPAAAGVAGDPRIASLARTEATRAKWSGNYPALPMEYLTSADNQAFFGDTTLYMQGVTPLQAYLSQLDTLWKHSYDTQLTTWTRSAKNPKGWDITKW